MATRSSRLAPSRQALAAVLGVVLLGSAAPAAAEPAQAQPQILAAHAAGELSSQVSPGPSLGELIEARLADAQQAGRYEEIEQLGSLWLSLERRDQLGRVVDRGEPFVAVSLRNERISAQRREARQRRFVPTEDTAMASMAASFASASPWGSMASAVVSPPDGQIEVAELVDRLEEPYRTAVALSLDGLSRRDVAEQMGVTPAAVRKWMQRLRERWDDWAE